MIRRYDHRLLTLGAAIDAQFTAVDERECPDLRDCIGTIHSLMTTAMLVEDTDDFAYALWVDDEEGPFPCYVLQKNPDQPTTLMTMMTADIHQLFVDECGQAWQDTILSITFDVEAP